MTDAPGRIVRRNNAPVRGRRPATTVPDVFFALATAGWAMALFFFLSSYLDQDVTVGEAGKVLARLFAGALAVAAAFTFLLGVVLLRDERNQSEHFFFPMLIGLLIGVLASLLFLTLHFEFVILPFFLLLLVIRPIRRRIFGRRRTTRSVTR